MSYRPCSIRSTAARVATYACLLFILQGTPEILLVRSLPSSEVKRCLRSRPVSRPQDQKLLPKKPSKCPSRVPSTFVNKSTVFPSCYDKLALTTNLIILITSEPPNRLPNPGLRRQVSCDGRMPSPSELHHPHSHDLCGQLPSSGSC